MTLLLSRFLRKKQQQQRSGSWPRTLGHNTKGRLSCHARSLSSFQMQEQPPPPAHAPEIGNARFFFQLLYPARSFLRLPRSADMFVQKSIRLITAPALWHQHGGHVLVSLSLARPFQIRFAKRVPATAAATHDNVVREERGQPDDTRTPKRTDGRLNAPGSLDFL